MYDPTLPTPRDRMRFSLGDIYSPPLREDVTYDALLSINSEPLATALMAESLASEYAQNPSSVSVGGVSVSYATLVSNWQAFAKRIRDDLPGGLASGSFTDGVSGRFATVDGEFVRPSGWFPGSDGDLW